MKKTGFFKKIVSVATMACLAFSFLSFGVSELKKTEIRGSALEYDSTKWKSSKEEMFEASEDGTLSVGKEKVYYTENLGDKLKLDKNGVLTITVEFSVQGIPLPTNAAHSIWFISPDGASWQDMTGEDGDPFLPEGNNNALGARMYFQNDDQVTSGRVLFRCCDYKNHRTADRFYGFNKDNTGKHEISWTITEEGVTMYVDGNALRSDSNNGNQPTYWPEKTAGTRWTLADFLDEQGNPSVYFGMMNEGFAEKITIHSLGNGIDYVAAGDYEGEKGKLTLEEDGAYLTDGTAYTIEEYDLNNEVSGSFEIKEVPAYVFEGLDTTAQAAVKKTAFSVDIKDALEDGYGFRINWKPLLSTGNEKTEIEFGYLTKAGFTTYSTYVVPSIAVAEHTYGFMYSDDFVKIMADGICENISLAESNALWDLSQNINTTAMKMYYSADSKYSDEYTGKWLVKLGDIIEETAGAWYVNSEDVQILGEKKAGEVEYDYRMYPTIAENQTISVDSKAQDISVLGNEPIKIYSKIDLNLEMTLKVSEIPAYQTETQNAFILLSFSNAVGGTTNMMTAVKAFFIRLAWKDATTLVAYCKMDVDAKEVTISNVGEEIKIEFGWDEDNSVIRINGETALKGAILKGHFGSASGVQGYFAVSVYNGAEEDTAKWTFTVSAPKHIKAVADEGTPDNNNQDTSTDEKPDISSDDGTTQQKGCSASVIGKGVVWALLAVCVVVVLKKKENV